MSSGFKWTQPSDEKRKKTHHVLGNTVKSDKILVRRNSKVNKDTMFCNDVIK